MHPWKESDVGVTSLKRVEEPDETFRLGFRVYLDLFKKIKKKRDEKSSPMSDEYLEAEKERLRKSHEANELFLSLSLSLSLLSLVSPLSC